MFYGEHLLADEETMKCERCAARSSVSPLVERGRSYGWFCPRCEYVVRKALVKHEALARASIRRKP